MNHFKLTFIALSVSTLVAAAETSKPNIVLILADDIGYGDFGCYGSKKIKTPNIDRLAQEGMRFTDAYAGAATCTPTRFSMLTGKHAWRQPGTGILSGDAPLCIPEGTSTIAQVMKKAGYTTAAIGKWHLGMGREGKTDYNAEIDAGPNTLGFDYSFLIPATGDRVPCVYVEDHKVVNLDPADPIKVSFRGNVFDSPTAKTHPELIRPTHRDPVHEIRGGSIVNGICRIGFMTGGQTALWQDDSIADTITNKAVHFIKENKDKPFFLYFSTHDVHAPIAPNPRFLGSSGFGRRGDTIHQFDWCVGEIMKTLDEQGVADNTLLIVTSDNGGCGVYAEQEKVYGQKINGPLRGYKVTPYEGGIREPFIARWPGVIPSGSVSEQIVGLVDCYATAADIVKQPLAEQDAPDSVSLLPVLTNPKQAVREQIITQSWVASNPDCAKQIRVGDWKLLVPGKRSKDQALQLYHLKDDLAEQNNLAKTQPAKVKELMERLEKAISDGRTR
ncbi:arylsulfatase [Verrucomicrobiaceae bacterium N1E253]|uniref:Arylsulfatase n=1 Tax=Oceaniferula marina TaxID=2748318 RepID=A0A851GJ54_9BACT|nr:arylsulfatase [Oceaniferula marina]NWK55901.1 arylsulfatase [Oceaniferula marina]